MWLLRRRRRFRVVGDSMQPTLNTGEMVLVAHFAYSKILPRAGDIVLARHPYQKLHIIKRVAALTADNRIVLHSDNAAAGSDSRQWGALHPSHILGKVTCRLEPLGKKS